MKQKKITTLLLFCLSLSLFCSFGAGNDFLLLSKNPTLVEVNNRVLSKINGKPITVYDVMKKMDILFYKQFPHYASSVEARFQFYGMRWKDMFKDIIEKELILLDGKEIGITLSAGDVRQEMQTLFGPNIITNLDKLGMSYQEAEDLLRDELIIRKTLAARVHSRILRLVSPQDIKNAYEEFAKNYEVKSSYVYYMATIRDKDLIRAKETAHLIRQKATALGLEKNRLEEEFSKKGLLDSFKTVSISNLLKVSDKEISEENKKILDQLANNEISQPLLQKNKKGSEEFLRLYYLVKKDSQEVPSFSDMEIKLKEKLMGAMQEKEIEAYLQKLYQNHHVNMEEMEKELPQNFQPFALK